MTAILRRTWSISRIVIGVVLAFLIVLTDIPVYAGERSPAEDAGLQAASWLVTIPYGAAKAAFALGGGIVGCLTWAFTGGNTAVAQEVWIPSMTGDYIVQPQNLTGEKHLHFIGGSTATTKP